MSAGAVVDPRDRALGGWLILGARQLGVTGITVVGVVTLGRLLGPSDFALFGYTTTATTVALAIGDFGLGSRIIREGLDDRQLGEIMALQLGLLVVLSALTVAGLAIASALGVREHLDVPIVACIGAATFITLLQTVPTAVLEGRLHFAAVGRIEVGQEFAFTAGAITVAVVGLKRLAVPLSALAAAAGAYVATLLIAHWRARPRLASPRKVLTGWALDWWLGRVAAQFSYASMAVLAGLILGAQAVGRLSLALSITALATILAPLVSRATFPAMVAATAADRVEVFAGVFRTYVVASVPALLVILVAAHEIIAVGFGHRWAGAVEVVRIMCLPALVGLALTPSLPLLYMLLEPRRVRRVLVVMFFGQWVLGAGGAALFGVIGLPVAAFVVAGLATLRLDGLLREAAVPFGLFAEILPALAVGAVAAAAGLGMTLALGEGLVPTLGAIVVALAVYFVGLGSRRRVLAPRALVRSFGSAVRSPDPATVPVVH